MWRMRPAAPRCLSPAPRRYDPTDGDWQLQDLPGAPGTARQGRTRIIVSTNRGGKATQPRAPGHERPPAAQRAARHGRLSADSGAPGADVPLASTARAPGHHRLSAVPIATVALPAGLPRLRQGVLPRVPANPRTLIYPHSHCTQPSFPLSRESTSPRCYGGATGGLRTGNPRRVFPHFPVPITPLNPSSASCHPGTAPPAVLLHRGHGLLPPAPLTRPAARPVSGILERMFPWAAA